MASCQMLNFPRCPPGSRQCSFGQISCHSLKCNLINLLSYLRNCVIYLSSLEGYVTSICSGKKKEGRTARSIWEGVLCSMCSESREPLKGHFMGTSQIGIWILFFFFPTTTKKTSITFSFNSLSSLPWMFKIL